jgi:serine protease AprX
MIRRLVAIAILATSASLAFGQSAKVARDLQNLRPTTSVDVIVQFTQVPTARHHQKVIARGGKLRAELKSIKGGAYTMPAEAIEDLAKDPEVTHISADHKLGALLDLSADAVNAASAWQAGLDGTGIGIAIIDSGLSNSNDLKNAQGALRVVYNWSYVGGGTDDHYGHGEHVAGIAAGNGSLSTGSIYTRTFKGMAPNANLINLRVLDQNGEGTDSGVIAAIDQAISLKAQYNIRVINLSLGRPVFESYTMDPLCQAVEAAWTAGIVVVAAAGNDGRDDSMGTEGYATITAPGNDPYVITVGAMKTEGTPTRTDDLIASYSSKGPTLIDHVVKPDLVAPGNLVVSLLASTATLQQTYPSTLIENDYYENNNQTNFSNNYYCLSGTSMATPVVSGAAADLIEAHPNLTPDQVKARLMKTAYKVFPASSTAVDPLTGQIYVDYYDIFTIGAGYLDIQAALADTSLATGTALSPTASYDQTSGDVYLVASSSSVWNTLSVSGSQSVWGLRSVWGNSVFLSGSNALWGSQAVWGSQSIWGNRAIWGTEAIWGTSTADAADILIHGEK